MKHKTMYGRHRGVLSVMIVALMLAFAGVLGSGGQAIADWSMDLPAGMACADFDLRIETTGSWPQVYKEFKDRDGNVIRIFQAGKGWDFLFTNLSTGATFPLKGNGSVSHYSYNLDGTYTYVGTGHNVMIFFPTDVPPGPSTIQVLGRVVSTVDENNVWTLQKLSGKQIDICEALTQ
jgi:hypothetical protein